MTALYRPRPNTLRMPRKTALYLAAMSFAVAALSCLLRKANEILTVIMAKK